VEQAKTPATASGTSSFDWLGDRLEQQIRWYGRAARRSRLGYLSLRLLTLCAAAAITVLSMTSWAPPGWQPTWLPGILGALIALLEGIQGLFRWRDQWLMYRATAEGLKREHSLYLAQAGPYAGSASPDALALLAVRAEQLMTSENTSWRQLHDRADERPAATHDRPTASSDNQGTTRG
jgi:hypothetical protein